eukprot:CAMPEP_0197640362 /NCGR_PEP_ID=MMETSP1338-20131121/14682_1 /TAXON_ID=43686 ORGANISM="Pelagodinium beii, Strain RCC1491" /NCGR_SAMPLE_ID=MMETSP1338 /ASSEMBLY_ACC=CAM_ASM_000754 /LENGTH=186 /DNA_ID=CAMNT_0043213207 /DNA_START=54 /DNA_END=614 /DNA_ORIENTATION=+
MAAGRSTRITSLAVLAVLALLIKGLNFTSGPFTRSVRVQRAGFEPGKVNLGVDGQFVEKKAMPKLVLEANEATNLAIQDCLEEGCSVEALMTLDAKLARDEGSIQTALKEMHASQAVEYSEDAVEQISWFENFLGRAGSLRAQLQAVSTLKSEGDFVGQFVRAASVAFGGGRHGDYPKVGVSPYSA